MTIMQNALHSFGGDWSWVPPKANTIGPREILGARHRSFWLDGDLGGGVSWQRFIARLVAHGPVSEFVPGLDPADGANRLHDPRRRRRRRRGCGRVRDVFRGRTRERSAFDRSAETNVGVRLRAHRTYVHTTRFVLSPGAVGDFDPRSPRASAPRCAGSFRAQVRHHRITTELIRRSSCINVPAAAAAAY